MSIDLSENAERALRYVREAKGLSYDTETSGVDWRVNNPIGYVIGPSSADVDTSTVQAGHVVYVPVRHQGGGNLPGCKPLQAPDDKIEIHPFEKELAKAFDDRNRLGIGPVVGHNTKFDAHFSANAGVYLGRSMVCTQNNAALLNEYARSFSLDACAESMGVEAKKGEELYQHMAQLFGGPATRSQMGNYWRLSGTDPLGYEYAVGDGVSTIQLWEAQLKQIDEEELTVVYRLESDLIWTLFRMERTGMAVDEKRINKLREATESRVSQLLNDLPIGFNTRSPVQMRKLMEEHGYTDWPTTEKGNPSFTEKWLKKNPIGQKVVAIRQATNLLNSFVNPLAEQHMFKGRVHASLNQLKSDDTGTISGRFSCSAPNLQQVPKHNKELAIPFRRLFVADEGWTFWERDWSQCFVAGTKVSVPASIKHPDGTVNIEDVEVGQLVYSFDDDRKLCLRPVVDAWKTGTRRVVRVKWMTNGRTYGEFVCTPDHRIRMVDGSYKTVEQLRSEPSGRRSQHPYNHRVLAMNRTLQGSKKRGDKPRWYLRATGHQRIIESRFVGLQTQGHHEHFHHKDENTLNNDPKNLMGVNEDGHVRLHAKHNEVEILGLVEKGFTNPQIAGMLGIPRQSVNNYRVKHNHIIYDIQDVEGEHAVYDITVADTHNFIANEVCAHNCEPRLFAHYAQDPQLLAGYNAVPFVDSHSMTAKLLGVERDPTAKRMNMGIFTGMQYNSLAGHMGCTPDEAKDYMRRWFEAYPNIKGFQNKAKLRLKNRGYVKTLLGRRCRLEHPRFAYVGTSKIIQGGNADIAKYVLLKMDRFGEDNGDVARVLMTVHDSFNGQYQKTPEGERVFKEMVAYMEDVQSEPLNLTVPFVSEGFDGQDWAEASYGLKGAA